MIRYMKKNKKEIREEAQKRIMSGKKLTKAQATALGQWAFVEWGCMPAQDQEFPGVFEYCGVEIDQFEADRTCEFGDITPKGADLENHQKICAAASVAYWKAKDRLN